MLLLQTNEVQFECFGQIRAEFAGHIECNGCASPLISGGWGKGGPRRQKNGWKWRKFSLQNVNYDLTAGFKDIEQEVFIFHGPKDKYHPDGTFRRVAQQIPRGRFFYMNTSAEYRELLAGIIATEFAMVTKNDGVPSFLQQFEATLRS